MEKFRHITIFKMKLGKNSVVSPLLGKLPEVLRELYIKYFNKFFKINQ